MSVTIHDVRRFRFNNMDFWPEDGLVHMEDRGDGSYHVITRRDALIRARSINEAAPYWEHASERDREHKFVADLISCVREAARQGDPADPEVIKQKVRERRREKKGCTMFLGVHLSGASPKTQEFNPPKPDPMIDSTGSL